MYHLSLRAWIHILTKKILPTEIITTTYVYSEQKFDTMWDERLYVFSYTETTLDQCGIIMSENPTQLTSLNCVFFNIWVRSVQTTSLRT